jgi:hypothetical protein
MNVIKEKVYLEDYICRYNKIERRLETLEICTPMKSSR